MFEKCRLAPYFDHKGIATIGKGMTRYPNGTQVTINDTPLTQSQADQMYEILFDQHVNDATIEWCEWFWNCPQSFKDAYASFVYNTGHVLGVNGYKTLNELIQDEIIQRYDPNERIVLSNAVLFQFAQAWMLYDDDRFDDNVQNNSTGLSIRRFAEVLILLKDYSASQAYKEAYRRGNDPNDGLDPVSLID